MFVKNQFSFFVDRPSSGSRPTSEVSNNEYSVDILQERVNLAHTISALEQQMADENYTPSKMNEQVLPEAANEMGEGKNALVSFYLGGFSQNFHNLNTLKEVSLYYSHFRSHV